MSHSDEVAPAVRSILAAARERDGGDERLAVEPRSLPAALSEATVEGRRPLIAEVKPTSPTTKDERTGDPTELARKMVAGGAAALSVLTEPTHFGGSPDALRAVREAVDVPVLRKDFLLEEAHLDVVEADVVLLIARFLDDLEGMLAAAEERGFQALVEVHNSAELERARAAGARIVGVNNRDLARLEVDLGTFEKVAPAVPEGTREARGDLQSPSEMRSVSEDVTLIAESGISTTADADRMLDAGADGLLVGSAIMDGDVRENTHRLTHE